MSVVKPPRSQTLNVLISALLSRARVLRLTTKAPLRACSIARSSCSDSCPLPSSLTPPSSPPRPPPLLLPLPLPPSRPPPLPTLAGGGGDALPELYFGSREAGEGFGVWHLKHSLFDAKTFAPHFGHVQSPARRSCSRFCSRSWRFSDAPSFFRNLHVLHVRHHAHSRACARVTERVCACVRA